jgi:predicted metalloprotease with PDZ domain
MSIRSFIFAAAATLMVSSAFAQTSPIRITADLSEAPRRLYHAEIDIPVTAGPLTLTTPKWIPGNHRPTGPAADITGVVFTANGETLRWRRDNIDLYQFHLTVPSGVTSLHVHLDTVVTTRVSDHLACLEWEKLLLYPANTATNQIPIEPSVTVLAGWGLGTALQPAGTGTPPPTTGVNEQYHQPPVGAVTTHFAATNVEQLEDSPVITGLYFHEYPLATELPVKHYIDVVTDQPGDGKLSDEYLARISNLVREANAAFGSHHYNVYHFLLTLSDVAGGEGLEHGQSSNVGANEKGYSDVNYASAVLAHEYTHSWNGKYRRPARLNQPTFALAEEGDLLWVYEGMTEYLGNVLATRSGMISKQQFLDTMAAVSAELEYQSGRDWRSTEDTAIAASILRGSDDRWSNWRRGLDFYDEGVLVWMDVDTKIRQLTDNKRSLTDFLKIFLGKGGSTGPEIVSYEFSELVKDLNQVVPYDWDKLLREKVNGINARADMDGITQGGYKLVYLDHPATYRSGSGHGASTTALWYSIGLQVSGARSATSAPSGATISDVRYGGPADAAKLYPGEQIIAVNGLSFSPEIISKAIRDASGKTAPIQLLVQHEGTVEKVDLSYNEGEKYPVLQRVDGTPDYLSDIIRPLTTLQHAPDYKP